MSGMVKPFQLPGRDLTTTSVTTLSASVGQGPRATAAPRVRAKPGRPSARAKLLQAALDLVLEGGAEALTYESLSQRSGLSKGGVLYHFPSREAMNKAIREHVRQQYRAARRAETEALPEGPSRALKGWAIASLYNRSGLDAVSARIMTSGLWNG